MGKIVHGQEIDSGMATTVHAGTLGDTIAATLRGLFMAAAGYVWDDSGGTWRRKLGDTEGRAMSVMHLWDSAASVWRYALGDSSGRIIGAAHDDSTVVDRVAEADPLSAHHVEETLADVTNGADDTYYYYADMDGYTSLSLHAVLDNGSGSCTMTVEGTKQDDGTAPGSCAYVDITADVAGAASFTGADSPIIIDDDGCLLGGYKYVRVKIVAATGAADDADWTLYSKRLYR